MGWMSLYESMCISTKAEGGLIFISEQEAKESIDTSLSYIATIKIKWEE